MPPIRPAEPLAFSISAKTHDAVSNGRARVVSPQLQACLPVETLGGPKLIVGGPLNGYRYHPTPQGAVAVQTPVGNLRADLSQLIISEPPQPRVPNWRMRPQITRTVMTQGRAGLSVALGFYALGLVLTALDRSLGRRAASLNVGIFISAGLASVAASRNDPFLIELTGDQAELADHFFHPGPIARAVGLMPQVVVAPNPN